MKLPNRKFEDKPAEESTAVTPLLFGIVGASSSGKTWSALELLTGMQRVFGGDIYFIDTETDRALQYKKFFKFRHVPLRAPFGPLDYEAAIRHCYDKGGRIIGIDSMTHEHSGEGGVMDQVDSFLDKKCGDNWDERAKNLMLAMVRPKQQRKHLNTSIVHLAFHGVFCYRAAEKIKPVTGQQPENRGWQPETTSPLHYEMTQRFLLRPGSDGVPDIAPKNDHERLMTKNPAQFRDFLKQGVRLSADLGEKFALWAKGEIKQSPTTVLIADFDRCTERDLLPNLEQRRADLWKKAKDDDKRDLKAASERAVARVAEYEKKAKTEPVVDETMDKKNRPHYDPSTDDPDAACPSCSGAGCDGCGGSGWRSMA